jgi:hypothetical protein
MSRAVTLYNGDSTKAYGNVLLPSDYPSDPSVLVWSNITFVAGNIAYGTPAPGNYESYIESDSLVLKDLDVVAPDKVPTKVD